MGHQLERVVDGDVKQEEAEVVRRLFGGWRSRMGEGACVIVVVWWTRAVLLLLRGIMGGAFTRLRGVYALLRGIKALLLCGELRGVKTKFRFGEMRENLIFDGIINAGLGKEGGDRGEKVQVFLGK